MAYTAGQKLRASDLPTVVARARRTTNGTSTTATTQGTSQGVLRLDDIPLISGRLYRVFCRGGVFASAYGRYSSSLQYTTDGSTPTNASASLQQAGGELANPGFVELYTMTVHYTPASNETFSVLLTYWRTNGTATLTHYGAADWPTEIVIEQLGVDPGATGTSI